MRALAYTLVALGLVLGVVGAASAYSVPLSLPDEALIGLTLNAPAGVARVDDGEAQPLLEKDHVLARADIERLRSSGAERVVVAEFSFARWSGRWLFLVSLLALGGGAAILRRSAARELADAASARAERGESPYELLQSVRESLAELERALAAHAEQDARLALLRERLDAVAQGPMARFLESTPEIGAALGTAGAARVLDRYAAAERRLNRAWSAAADGVEEEALDSLEVARESLDEAIERAVPLKGGPAGASSRAA